MPGLLTEKVHALLRSLPKRLRTRFTPARETAEGAAEALVFGEGDLFDALAAYLSKIGPEGVSAADFAPEKLPEHLRMQLVVRDAGGTEIGRGRHLEALIEALGEQARSAFRERVALDGEEWESRGLLHFPNASVPGLLHLKGAHGDVCAWPALVDEGRSVGVTLFDRKVDAERAHRRGVLRVFTLRSGEPMSGLIDWLLTERGLELAYAPLGTSEQLRTEIDGLVAEASFLAAGVDPWVIRDAETFEELFQDGCAQLGVRAEEVVGALEGLLRVRNELLTRFEGAAPQGWADALEDMVREVKRLAPAQLAEVGWQAIREAPRRLEALSRRHDRLAEKGPRRDRLDRDELEPWLLRLEAARSCCARSTALRSFEFALDELRVRLAAPGLALPEAASQRVLRASWNAVCACTPARLEQIK